MLEKHTPRAVTRVVPRDNLSIIALVGDGLVHSHGLAYRMVGAVAEKRIDLKIVSVGASDSAVYCVVDRVDREAAVRVIHGAFFKS